MPRSFVKAKLRRRRFIFNASSTRQEQKPSRISKNAMSLKIHWESFRSSRPARSREGHTKFGFTYPPSDTSSLVIKFTVPQRIYTWNLLRRAGRPPSFRDCIFLAMLCTPPVSRLNGRANSSSGNAHCRPICGNGWRDPKVLSPPTISLPPCGGFPPTPSPDRNPPRSPPQHENEPDRPRIPPS